MTPREKDLSGHHSISATGIARTSLAQVQVIQQYGHLGVLDNLSTSLDSPCDVRNAYDTTE